MNDATRRPSSSLSPLVKSEKGALIPTEMDWDTDEPTLTTGLSALLASGMRTGSTLPPADVRENSDPKSSYHLRSPGLAVFLGTFAGLLAVWTFAPPTESTSQIGGSGPIREIHILEVPPTVADVPELTLEDRARLGEDDAIEQLRAQGDSLTSRQLVALVEGETVLEMRRIEEEHAPPAALLRAATGVRPKVHELRVLSELPGAAAADALHQIWAHSLETSDPATETEQLARRLLLTSDVRNRASSALKAALALYDADDCESARAAMTRAEEVGDRRSAHGVQQVAGGSACDADDEECQRCVEHRSLTHRAFLAVKERPICLSWNCQTAQEHAPTPIASSETPAAFAVAIKEHHD